MSSVRALVWLSVPLGVVVLMLSFFALMTGDPPAPHWLLWAGMIGGAIAASWAIWAPPSPDEGGW